MVLQTIGKKQEVLFAVGFKKEYTSYILVVRVVSHKLEAIATPLLITWHLISQIRGRSRV